MKTFAEMTQEEFIKDFLNNCPGTQPLETLDKDGFHYKFVYKLAADLYVTLHELNAEAKRVYDK